MSRPEEALLQDQINAVKRLQSGLCNKDTVAHCSIWVLSELLDELIQDVAIETHRLSLQGPHSAQSEDDKVLDAPPPSEEELKQWGEKNKRDVFGQTTAQLTSASSEFITCINCQRPIMSSRFAPHLEKCMGKGRLASRSARRPTYTEPPALNFPKQPPKVQPVKRKAPPGSSNAHSSGPPSKAAHLSQSSQGGQPPQHPISNTNSYHRNTPESSAPSVKVVGPSFDGPKHNSAPTPGKIDLEQEMRKEMLLAESSSSKKKTKKGELPLNSIGKLRRKVRSVLADSVKISDLNAYTHIRGGAALSLSASAIAESATNFRRLDGMDWDAAKNFSRNEDIRVILEHVCCVVSQRDSTKDKICANSTNCPIHTPAQRWDIRKMFNVDKPASADAAHPPLPKLKIQRGQLQAASSAKPSSNSGKPQAANSKPVKPRIHVSQRAAVPDLDAITDGLLADDFYGDGDEELDDPNDVLFDIKNEGLNFLV